MTVIGYIRQSKRADLDVALSYDSQLAAIRRLAERDGIDPASVRIFADMGRSGAAGKERLRPAYLEAIALLEAGGIDTIYTLSLTRLARSAGELERVADVCEAQGTRLVTDKEGAHDPRNPMQSALFGMIGVFAKFERELAVQRARDNVAVRRSRGERMGRVPYGERPGDKPDAVVDAYHKASGSLDGTARLLNQRGVKSWAGVDWTGPAVRLVIKRLLPGVIPNDPKRGVKPSSPFLLFRLLRCPCGRIMTASRDGRDNREPVYRCHAASTQVDHQRPYRVGESAVLGWIKTEAARFRVPADAIEMNAANDAARVKLEDQRRGVGDALTVRAYTPAEAVQKVAEIEAALAALDDRTELRDLPAIDWTWAPGDINGILSKMFEYIELGPDLQPVRAERRPPAEYWA